MSHHIQGKIEKLWGHNKLSHILHDFSRCCWQCMPTGDAHCVRSLILFRKIFVAWDSQLFWFWNARNVALPHFDWKGKGISYFRSTLPTFAGSIVSSVHFLTCPFSHGLNTLDSLIFVRYQFSWFSWRVRSTKSSTQEKKIFGTNYEGKCYGHRVWTPRMFNFCLIHENWYPRK